MAVAAGQSQRFYSGVGIFSWYYLSSPPEIPRVPVVDLKLGGLTLHTYMVTAKQCAVLAWYVQYGVRVSTSTVQYSYILILYRSHITY
jgi:hypothetical protein